MRRFKRRGSVRQAITIDDLRTMARRRLPYLISEFLEGGVENEITLRRNRAVFDDYAFVWKTLNDVSTRELTCKVFEAETGLPIAVAPTGSAGLFSSAGDVALADAAAGKRIPFIQSFFSTTALEVIAKHAGGRHWMQIFMLDDKGAMEAIIHRAASAGCEALVLTVDNKIYGNKEWDRRNYTPAGQPTSLAVLEMLRHPRWIADVPLRGFPTYQNLAQYVPPESRSLLGMRTYFSTRLDLTVGLADVAWLRKLWERKLVIKGILDATEATQLANEGVDAVVISNHGGRQLDGVISPLQALAQVKQAVGDRIHVFIDSGFRRGTDVVKALGLGADLVLLGRVPLYGLAAGGRAGAERALEIIEEELGRTIGLLGATHWRDCADRIVRA